MCFYGYKNSNVTARVEPEIVEKWIDGLNNEFKSLEFMPERFSKTDETIWDEKEIRKLSYKNHLVYFRINKETAEVWVIAVIYGKRDRIARLKDSGI